MTVKIYELAIVRAKQKCHDTFKNKILCHEIDYKVHFPRPFTNGNITAALYPKQETYTSTEHINGS